MRIVVPIFPNSLSTTLTFPFKACTLDFTIYKPTPAPPIFSVVVLYKPKTQSHFSFGIPIPVSETSITRLFLSIKDVHFIILSFVLAKALIELSIILSN